MRTIAALMFSVVCSSVFGQIELSCKLALATDKPSPTAVGDYVVYPADYVFAPRQIAVIEAKTDAKDVTLWAVNPLGETIDLVPATSNHWILDARGRWTILAACHDADGKEYRDTDSITIGKVDPPQPPDPPEPPKPDVPNEYHVGQTSFSSAPHDEPTAKKLAADYRVGASYLFGQGGLKDIQAIINEINAKFASTKFTNETTGQAWLQWQAKVKSALTAEQTKRKTFSRNDWYSCLIEIAVSLEAVK